MGTKMTIFFRKSTGDLADIIQGEQTMDMYGELKTDYELIYSFVVVDFDEYVMKNSRLFCIVDGKVKLKDVDELKKYM
ncbi:hypothetical protein [Clostridium beijerinckii]|uniref:Phage protein n=1 Tax=Clostridium beijerinckii TaxID=1520 RepID=A0AAX0AYS2_CLOBE|nr:hypothetical protein [Clostridium beijerinckii]NRT88096.1 hypothetical protein [Clostridium beijerinckii]NYC73524.1 hypothetical protein [Clostridium beijerinckii]